MNEGIMAEIVKVFPRSKYTEYGRGGEVHYCKQDNCNKVTKSLFADTYILPDSEKKENTDSDC